MTRERAVELLRELWNFLATPPEIDEAVNMAIEALQHKPKTGKWEDKGDYYVCSECGERMPYAVLGPGFSRAYAFMSDYCPHCGSPMEVESDEE